MVSLSLPPLSVYYCYDFVDIDFCKALDTHLDPLKRRGWICTWDDQQIPAGAEREREREAHLHTAHLLVLLISADFLASESGIQMIQVALQRHRDGEAIAIPILVRAANWEETDLHVLQVLPREQKAIQAWQSQDDIWREVTKEIQQVIQTMRQWVFVASSPEDHEFVEQLRQDLISSGVLLWSMEQGQEENQRDAMRTASVVILIASPDAPASRLVKAQLALAADYQRPILVVWARGEDWKSSNPGNWQVQDAIDVRGRSYETTRKFLLIRLRQVVADLPPLVSPNLHTEPRNPYKGLHAFTSDDARDFFGRGALIDELATTVETMLSLEKQEGQQIRLLPVIGSSGSGKSSVVMAGLLPHFKSEGIMDSQEWVYLQPIFPGVHPLESLAVSFAAQFPARSVLSLHEDFASDSVRALHLLASQLVHPSQKKVVLVIDQFEELFTLTATEEERQHFLDLLITAVTEPSGPVLVILTLRADFYDRLMQYPEFYRLFDKHHISVLPMDSEDLRMVIEQPAHLPDVQLTFDGDLVGDLLFEMRGQAGALPLLQFTLDQLFQQREGHLLSLHAYHKMGGVKGALSQHAEETYQALPSDEHRRLARDIFLRLIEPGITEHDTTRRRAALSEFDLAETFGQQQMQETLDAFIKARLLTTNQNRSTTTVEVSHEAVIREWERLADWLHEARDDIHFQQSFSEDVTGWEHRNRPGDRLYRGVQLKEAQAWAGRNRPNKQEAAFLQASATRRIQSLVIRVIVVLLLLSVMFTGGFYLVTRPPDPTVVTTLQDNVSGSLRYCVNNASSGSTITFAANLRGTIKLTGGDLVIQENKQLTLRGGSDANRITINGGTNARIRISQRSTLNIYDLSFKDSQLFVIGFLYNDGTLTMTDSIVSNNKNTYGVSGGTIENNTTGTLIMRHSIISDNVAIGQNSYASGGAINNDGNLTVIDSTLQDNQSIGQGQFGLGGAIKNWKTGSIKIINSTISGNTVTSDIGDAEGGGIENLGVLDVSNSTISGNKAVSPKGTSYGGGIDTGDTSTTLVSNSTFSDNSATGDQNGQGGGIDNEGKLTMVNNTFSKNSASGSNGSTGFGGGIYNYNTGIVLVEASTFSDNSVTGDQNSEGGGIYNGGAVTLSNSIIAANRAPNGPDISGTLTSGGYNLLTNPTSANGLSNTDQQVTLDNLQLDQTLGNNGGPTQTLKLLPGSPAIDAIPQQACSITITDPVSGHTMTITTDQRGDRRPDGSESACDVGAYESSY